MILLRGSRLFLSAASVFPVFSNPLYGHFIRNVRLSSFPVLLVLMAYGAGGVWQRYARTGTPMKAAMAAASFAASTDPLESAALIRE